MKYKYVLFDLDGTLTDPKTGITKSVKYGLESCGIKNVSLSELEVFIGPPLKESFMTYYPLAEKQALKAIEYYREYFSNKGLFENKVYKGILELLAELKLAGVVLAVATLKPTVYAKRILDHFGLTDFFCEILGSNLDGTMNDKKDIINKLLVKLDVDKKEEVVMIGDRKHDIIAAQKAGVESIGLLYGYGSKEEISDVTPTHIVESVNQLRSLLTCF